MQQQQQPSIKQCVDFPQTLNSCNAFQQLSECITNSYLYITYTQNFIRNDDDNNEEDISDKREQIAKNLEIIENKYIEFYIMKDRYFDDENKYSTQDTGMNEKPDSRKVVLIVIFSSRILKTILLSSSSTNNNSSSSSIAVSSSLSAKNDMQKWTALDIPDVVNQLLVQSSKPILQYDAMELIQALDALAFRWTLDVNHSPGIDRYIYLLSLRFGIFLLCGMPIADFGTDSSLRKKPVCIKGSDDEICTLSRVFFVHATARIMAFSTFTWICAQYETIILDDTPITVQCEMSKLFLRYTRDGINNVVIPPEFSRLFQGFSLCPGDPLAFRAKNRFKMCTIRNMLRLLHGKRFVRQIYKQATQIGPVVALTLAVKKLQEKKGKDEESDKNLRSNLDLDAEVAAICVLDALLRGKYNVSWMDNFFVTMNNHNMYFFDDACSIPRICFLVNTFDVLYQKKRFKTSNAVASICLWLKIIQHEFKGFKKKFFL